MQKRILIKIGGAALVDKITLDSVANGIRELQRSNTEIIIVHGGGPAINAKLTQRGISWSFINGQRQTTPQMMAVIRDTLCNTVNPDIVNHLNSQGLQVSPLFGDQNILWCEQQSQELGRVGAITAVDIDPISTLLEDCKIPVIAPIGVDGSGQIYNINADRAAAHIAMALKVDSLVFLTDQDGVWDENQQIISLLSDSQIQQWINTGVVVGGMLAKLHSTLSALSAGITNVRILNGRNAQMGLIDSTIGTTCIQKPHQNLSEDNAHAAV